MKTLFFFSFFCSLSLSSREAKKKKEEVDELRARTFVVDEHQNFFRRPKTFIEKHTISTLAP